MKVVRHILDGACVLELNCRHDCRGDMKDLSPEELQAAVPGFTVREQRIYTMPEPHTFFGIHFQGQPYPQAKIITVLRGSGLDYIVDLRKNSDSYKQWRTVELKAEEPFAVYIPAGFGHAFLSLEKDTVQFFAADQRFVNEKAGQINYRDPDLQLVLPCDDPILSEKDSKAPFLRDLQKAGQ